MPTRRFVSNAREGGVARPGRASRERVTRLESFVSRLREVGASDQEVNDLVDVWNEHDDPHDSNWITTRDRLVRLSDTDLRRLLEQARREWYEHTHTPAEEEADKRAARLDGYRAELAVSPDHKVAHLIEWADGDPERAAVALEWEQARDPAHGPRVTLVNALQPIADTTELPPGASMEASADGGGTGDEAGQVPGGDLPGPIVDEHQGIAL